MTDRKKKGIGFLITGGLFAVVGLVLVIATETPDIIGTIISIAGMIGEALGFKIVYPDVEE